MAAEQETKARQAITEQARHWIIEIDAGDFSPADEARFRYWLNKKPEHQQAFQDLEHRWRGFDRMQRLRSVSADPVALEKWVRNRRSCRLPDPFAVAASAALVMAGMWLLQAPSVHELEHRTAVGEHRTVVLPDDSMVTLNTDTRVRVSYTDNERRIELQRGEALFEVEPERGRPFLVTAGDGVVRAVGTAFSIYLREGAVDVLVTEGTVEVRASTGPASEPASVTATDSRLDQGQKLTQRHRMRYGHKVVESVAAVTAAEMKRSLAWRDGMLDFEGAPLSEVIAEANRYLREKFVIKDSELGTMELTGYFRAGDADLLIKLLESNEILQTTRIDYRTVQIARAEKIPETSSSMP